MQRIKRLPTIEHGAGMAVVVLGGGPGFKTSYMVDPLIAESALRLVRIEEREAKGMTPSELALTLSQFVEDSTLTVLAHSWGAVRLLVALQRMPDVQARGVLVAPVPTTWSQFSDMRTRFLAQLPGKTIEWLSDPASDQLTCEQVDEILPYYLSHRALSRPKLTFDIRAYRTELSVFAGYDVRASLDQLSGCVVVLGSDDFLRPQDISDVMSAVRSTYIVPDAGHFVHHEQRESFLAHLRAAIH